MNGVRICRFDSTLDLRGCQRTYEAIKARVLEAGRFSAFEATSNPRNAALFTRLGRDPEIETFKDPPEYPWVGVRKRQAAPEAHEKLIHDTEACRVPECPACMAEDGELNE